MGLPWSDRNRRTWSIQRRRQHAKPLIELCNPGIARDKSEFTENVKDLKKKYQERFLEPLLKQIDALLPTQTERYSHIFEMMQLVAINGFRKHGVKGERHLVVMSDMLHNTPQFSMYKGSVDYSAFASSPLGKKTQLALPGVKVEIHLLMSNPQLQTKQHITFWEAYFGKARAHVDAGAELTRCAGFDLTSVRPMNALVSR